MADGGEVAEMASSPVQPSPVRTTQSPPHSASLDELRAKAHQEIQEMKAKALQGIQEMRAKVALEMEDWKRNQKKKFKEEVSCSCQRFTGAYRHRLKA